MGAKHFLTGIFSDPNETYVDESGGGKGGVNSNTDSKRECVMQLIHIGLVRILDVRLR